MHLQQPQTRVPRPHSSSGAAAARTNSAGSGNGSGLNSAVAMLESSAVGQFARGRSVESESGSSGGDLVSLGSSNGASNHFPQAGSNANAGTTATSKSTRHILGKKLHAAGVALVMGSGNSLSFNNLDDLGDTSADHFGQALHSNSSSSNRASRGSSITTGGQQVGSDAITTAAAAAGQSGDGMYRQRSRSTPVPAHIAAAAASASTGEGTPRGDYGSSTSGQQHPPMEQPVGIAAVRDDFSGITLEHSSTAGASGSNKYPSPTAKSIRSVQAAVLRG
jgi:hypothetical protein